MHSRPVHPGSEAEMATPKPRPSYAPNHSASKGIRAPQFTIIVPRQHPKSCQQAPSPISTRNHAHRELSARWASCPKVHDRTAARVSNPVANITELGFYDTQPCSANTRGVANARFVRWWRGGAERMVVLPATVGAVRQQSGRAPRAGGRQRSEGPALSLWLKIF